MDLNWGHVPYVISQFWENSRKVNVSCVTSGSALSCWNTTSHTYISSDEEVYFQVFLRSNRFTEKNWAYNTQHSTPDTNSDWV